VASAGSRRPPCSPITAAGTPTGARTACEVLLVGLPGEVDSYWRAWTRVLLAALLEAAALARRARRRGHRHVPVGSEATLQGWLVTVEDRMPPDVRAVLVLALDGELGDDAARLGLDCARRLIAFYRELDVRCRRQVVALAGFALTHRRSVPPEITVDEWFAAGWLAVTGGDERPDPFHHVTAVRAAAAGGATAAR
jgi:hypothetical protein